MISFQEYEGEGYGTRKSKINIITYNKARPDYKHYVLMTKKHWIAYFPFKSKLPTGFYYRRIG